MGKKSPELVTITFSSSAIFKALMVVGLFAALYYLFDIVLIVLTAVVIASAIEPATRWIIKFKVPRTVAVILMYILLFSILGGVVYFFIPALIADIISISSRIPDLLSAIPWDPLSGEGAAISNTASTNVVNDIIRAISTLFTGQSGGIFGTISLIFGGAFSFALIAVLSFYFAVQENGIANFLRLITPPEHEGYVIDLWRRTQNKIAKWLQGQLLLGVLIGVLVYLGLMITGYFYFDGPFPNALLFAVIAGLFEIIPVFGPILAAVPPVLLGFLDSFTLGITVIILYIVIQQFENHLIYPLVVQKVVGVQPILVILALIVGAKIAGFLGIILSVPVAAAIVEYTNDVAKRKNLFERGEEGGSVENN